MHYLIVGLGGALGAVCRVFLGKLFPHAIFNLPLPILIVNILGCFMIGALTEVFALHWPASMNIRSFLVPGFLSGFTTFSAFALESGILYNKGSYFLVFLYIVLTVVLSLAAFWGGLKLVRLFS